jgi:ABC-type iron transport system FetAB ATPase subunit
MLSQDGLIMNQLSVHHVGPVDLHVARGECVALSGPSGAGKSLLLKSIADLVPHGGEVFLNEKPCYALSPPQWRRKVGLLPAESQWWVEQVGPHFETQPDDSTDWLGLGPEVMTWEVERLSSGERQRLALLRLLANRPQVLLLDEPTANLDPANIERVEALLSKLGSEQGMAMVWVSHDAAQIERVADRHFRLESRLIPVPVGTTARSLARTSSANLSLS